MQEKHALVVYDSQTPAAQPTGAIVDVKVRAPKAILSGVRDLLVAFATNTQLQDKDRTRLVRLFVEATEPFHPAVAEFAIEHLRWHNPRNPFAPTPQDVRELCERIDKTWECRVSNHFIGFVDDDFEWGEDKKWVLPRYDKEKKPKPLPWGPAPLTEGCWIPSDLVLHYLRTYIAREHVQRHLVDMDEKKFLGIPTEGFPDGVRELILEKRRQKAEAEEKQRQWDKCYASLPNDLRQAVDGYV